MRRQNLKQELLKKVLPNPIKMEKSFGLEQNIFNDHGLLNHEIINKEASSLKIIGITGSKGKSTTAYIIHEFLKRQGYKSILYSSIEIDSPVSFDEKKGSC